MDIVGQYLYIVDYCQGNCLILLDIVIYCWILLVSLKYILCFWRWSCKFLINSICNMHTGRTHWENKIDVQILKGFLVNFENLCSKIYFGFFNPWSLRYKIVVQCRNKNLTLKIGTKILLNVGLLVPLLSTNPRNFLLPPAPLVLPTLSQSYLISFNFLCFLEAEGPCSSRMFWDLLFLFPVFLILHAKRPLLNCLHTFFLMGILSTDFTLYIWSSHTSAHTT